MGRSSSKPTMPTPQCDPEYDHEDDYDFRSEVVADATAKSEAAGYRLNQRLLTLCNRFGLGEMSEDEFKLEIVRPFLH